VEDNKVTLYGVGDVSLVHEPVEPFSELIRGEMAKADIRFCASERTFSDRGTAQLNVGVAAKPLPPNMASVFADCNFDVVSPASNHVMDWGVEAMLDTRDAITSLGIQSIGVGEDLQEACRPAIIEWNGVRTAFLSFCSLLREGCAAGPNTPGVAPMRAHAYFEPRSFQPGFPPRVVTIPYADDLANMIKCIKEAKQAADAVVLSIHWGIAIIPRIIADYQRTVAEAAASAGADVILGHHAHVPKAIGVYSGTACFYSLGNFIVTSKMDPSKRPAFARDHGIELDPDYPMLPFGKDAKRSLIAKILLSKSGVDRVSFLPMMLDTQCRPELLEPSDPRFNEMVSFMEWVSEDFPHEFSITNNEVLISPPKDTR
jgi:poly-gamma-glutamate synthesis protein (capsule biosynthesis protein)